MRTIETASGRRYTTKYALNWNTAGNHFHARLNVPQNLMGVIGTARTTGILELLRCHPRIHWTVAVTAPRFGRDDGLSFFLRDVAVVGQGKCEVELKRVAYHRFECPEIPPSQRHQHLEIDGWWGLRSFDLASNGVARSFLVHNCQHLERITCQHQPNPGLTQRTEDGHCGNGGGKSREWNSAIGVQRLWLVDCPGLHSISDAVLADAEVVGIQDCPLLPRLVLPKCRALTVRMTDSWRDTHEKQIQNLPWAPEARQLTLVLSRLDPTAPLLNVADICPATTDLTVIGGGCRIPATVSKVRASYVEGLTFEAPENVRSLELRHPDPASFDFQQITRKMTRLEDLVVDQACYSVETVITMLDFFESVTSTQHLGNTLEPGVGSATPRLKQCAFSLVSQSLRFTYSIGSLNPNPNVCVTLETPTTFWTGDATKPGLFRYLKRLFINVFLA